MGEHTDFGIVTLLWADDVKGLQVLDADGAWHDVSPLPGALLINFGDLMARWTNERWRSTLHRVKPPIVDGTIRRRRSAAFFLDGNHDALIAALPGVVPAGESPLYPPITVAEHIAAKLAGSRDLQVNTAGTEREAERVTASRG
jgi:isopenicillin N synthase-like dioxygenase